MLTLVLFPLLTALTFLLYRHLKRQPDARALWRSTIAIGLIVGITRAVIASVGWYGVEHTGGSLQVPAYALAMLAWPEGAVLGPYPGVAPLSFYFWLGALLIASTLLAVSAVAYAVQWSRGQHDR